MRARNALMNAKASCSSPPIYSNPNYAIIFMAPYDVGPFALSNPEKK
jgi:hypothetical protein